MVQFRCGVLPLRVKTECFRGKPVTERTCKFCSLDEIEDRFHFVLKCSLYKNFRSELYQNVTFPNTSYLTPKKIFKLSSVIVRDKLQMLYVHPKKLSQSKFVCMH